MTRATFTIAVVFLPTTAPAKQLRDSRFGYTNAGHHGRGPRNLLKNLCNTYRSAKQQHRRASGGSGVLRSEIGKGEPNQRKTGMGTISRRTVPSGISILRAISRRPTPGCVASLNLLPGFTGDLSAHLLAAVRVH